MSRVVLYGMGQVFEACRNKINWEEVIAIADQKAVQGQQFQGIPVIPPSKLQEVSFDFLVVFSSKLFEDIRVELTGQYFIPIWKVISWRAYVWEKASRDFSSLAFLAELCKEYEFQRILDLDCGWLPKYSFSKQRFGDGEVQLDGLGNDQWNFEKAIYTTKYESLEQVGTGYDVAICKDAGYEWDLVLKKLKGRTKYILICMDYLNEVGELEAELSFENRKVKHFFTETNRFYLLHMSDVDENVQCLQHCAIYVVTHKPYQVLCDELYHPVCVGNYTNPIFLTEKEGENIAYLNEKINECTALYWIWKNTDTQYVGLNHYRRYFYNNDIIDAGNYLDARRVRELLEKYDIIMPKLSIRCNGTILEEIQESISCEAFEIGLRAVRESMEKFQPDYVESFEYVMQGHKEYVCNLFVTKREILDDYCQWLFSFIIEAAEQIDISAFDEYSKRVIGFFAERMWTVWLTKHSFKIKELPLVKPSN